MRGCTERELKPDGSVTCRHYEKYKDDPRFAMNPAFGGGCCSPLFNDVREARIRKKVQHDSATVDAGPDQSRT